LDNDLVVESNPLGRLFGIGPEVPIVQQYGTHAITREMGGVSTLFPLTRSMSKVTPLPTGVSWEPLARTSEQSWGETARAARPPAGGLPGARARARRRHHRRRPPPRPVAPRDALADDRGRGRRPPGARRLLLRLRDQGRARAREGRGAEGASLDGGRRRRHG